MNDNFSVLGIENGISLIIWSGQETDYQELMKDLIRIYESDTVFRLVSAKNIILVQNFQDDVNRFEIQYTDKDGISHSQFFTSTPQEMNAVFEQFSTKINS